MKLSFLLKRSLVAILLISGLSAPKQINAQLAAKPGDPKIQVAILLDVSNSMDGLIEQAKAQLWNMVSVMGRAKCMAKTPSIEIALYEYGRDNNDVKKGYIKQINPFMADLDVLSQNLFKLTTFGGSEYCGQVILTSLDELQWDNNAATYKVIFIAGNEDFLQGTVQYTEACTKAKQKGVIVNTIYCGDRMQGIREHWNLGGECGNGSFTNINQNERIQDPPTPYDTTIIALNSQLNGTYLYYGEVGVAGYGRQKEMDQANASMSVGVGAKRAAVKADGRVYNNAGWDLIDRFQSDSSYIATVDMKTLPDSLQNKSRAELKKVVDEKTKERAAIQRQIIDLNTQRDKFISTEKARNAGNAGATLETEVEKIIKEQAKRYNMVIE